MESTSLNPGRDAPVIDAHQHFWRLSAQLHTWRGPDHHAIARDYQPQHLGPLLRAAGVDGTILVQSADLPEENARLRDFAHDAPFVRGIVAWLPLASASDALDELAKIWSPIVRGVRCLVAEDPLAWLGTSESLHLFEGLAARDLVWEVVSTTHLQRQAIRALCGRIPGLRVVVDHMGRPPMDRGGWQPWADDMAALAALPNVSVKVSVGQSVLSGWSRWEPELMAPYVRHLATEFGSERLMTASNWPVIELRAAYRAAWQALVDHIEQVFPAPLDRSRVLGGTAMAVYGLP